MSDPEVRARSKSKALYTSCMFHELFDSWIERLGNVQEKVYESLSDLVDNGMQLTAAEPGYVHDNDEVHEGNIKVAISKAKLTGRIDAMKYIFVQAESPVEGGTTFEHTLPLSDLWVVRQNYERACNSLGIFDPPWPEVEFLRHWPLATKLSELQKKRDDLENTRAKRLDEKLRKDEKLSEIDREIAALEDKIRRLDGESAAALTETTSKPRPKPPQAAQRDDALARLARKTYKGLCEEGEKPTFRQVIHALQSFDALEDELNNVIEEIDHKHEVITWVDDRGREQSTSFAGFEKRMTRIRKTPPSR